MQLYRFNNRTWFAVAVGIVVVAALLFSFGMIFNWLPKGGQLDVLWELLRFTLGALVLLAWGMLNVTPPRPGGFVIAFAEFGEEREADGAAQGLLRPARTRLRAIMRREMQAGFDEDEPAAVGNSRFLNELRQIRHTQPSANLPAGRGVRALPAGRVGSNSSASPATTTALALADRQNKTATAGADGGNPAFGQGRTNSGGGRVLGRSTGEPFLSEFDDNTRPAPKVKFQPPEQFFAWEEAVGAHALTDYLQETLKTELNDTDLGSAVSLYPLAVFVKSRESALREAEVPRAHAVVWGWNAFHKRRDFVAVFELKEPLENKRPAPGQMQILGLKSFDLGTQTARQSSIFSAFVAGLGAYGYAGETHNKDEHHFYQKARSEFSLALTASYMYSDRDHYQDAIDRAIIYFFLGNTLYYLGDLDNSANAFREALAIDPEMIEARHNMGVVLFMQRKFDFALKSLIKVIQLRPNLAIARLNLGVAYLARGQYPAARRELQNAIKLDSKYAAAYRIIGVSYREEKDFDRALQFLQEALRVSPQARYAEARVDLALVYAEQSENQEISDDEANALYRAATRELSTAIVENPALPEAHYHLARLLYEGGQEDEAGLALLEAVRIRPGYSDAHELLAEIYEKRGRIDLRDKHLELMMKARQASSATTVEEHIRRGIGARLTKNYELAREELEKALRMEPRNAKALYELGMVYQELDDQDKALLTFQMVLKLPQPPVDTYNRISIIKFQQEDRQGAVDLLREAVAQDPTNPNLHYFLGNAYRKQKTDGKAIDSYIKAIQLDPNMADPHFNLGMIYLARKQTNDAILQFREVVRIRKEDHMTWLLLGRAYRQNNQTEAAVEAIEEAISLKSDFLEARRLLGEIYLRQAEPERAIEQLLMVQTHNPNDLGARELMGKAYAQAGQLERAIEVFQDIILVAPDSATAHYNLGVSYVSQRRYRESVNEFAAVTQIKPDDADAYFNMGVAIHEILNGPEQAYIEAAQVDIYFKQEVDSFNRAIRLRPTNPEPFRYLGQLYTRINNLAEAKRYFDQYQRLKK